jgi:hypothetical protein
LPAPLPVIGVREVSLLREREPRTPIVTSR